MNVHSFLEKTAERLPGKEAIVCGGRRLSYSEVDSLANRVRNFLCTKVSRQEPVALLLENSVEFVLSYFGILKAGCICVPIDANATDQTLAGKVRDSGARLIISQKKFRQKLERSGALEIAEYLDCENVPEAEDAEREVSGSDVCSILYTSGTTGEPKGVVLRHRNVVAATGNIVNYIGIDESDVDVNALPYTHSFGLGNIHCCFRQGGRVVVLRNFINLKGLLDAIESEKATSFSAPPAIFKLLVENFPERLSQCGRYLKYTVSNTNFMPKETGLSLLRILRGVRIYMYYGLTEASRSSFNLYNENVEKVESVGKPAPNVEIRVVDESMKQLKAGEMGEVVIKGGHVIDSYWKNPEEARNSIVSGWLRTGDLGYFDQEGYLWLAGRKDHMINVAGQKVSPREIEDVLCRCPGVTEAAAVGFRDPVLNEVVKAFVVGDGKLSAERLVRFCRERMEGYKVPRYVEFVGSLPRTDTGKLKRGLLR